MQIDYKIAQIKLHRIVRPCCCDNMESFLKRSTFDPRLGIIKVSTEGSLGRPGEIYRIDYCPFCGEKITYSETY